MKKWIYTAILVFSPGIWSCPDLSGMYVCNDEEVTVDTFELNGLNYLELNGGGGVPADANWSQLPDSEQMKNAKIRLTCGENDIFGSHFLLDYELDLYNRNEHEAFLDLEVYYYMENDSLVQNTIGVAKHDLGEDPITEKIVCTKK